MDKADAVNKIIDYAKSLNITELLFFAIIGEILCCRQACQPKEEDEAFLNGMGNIIEKYREKIAKRNT